MITRFYVDNYKCLVNFEYKPQPFELIIGANGSGKSTVFEALDKVRQFLTGKMDARELFPPASGTKWSRSAIQTFEVEISNEESILTYRIELDLFSEEYRVEKEILCDVDKVVLETTWKDSLESQFGSSAQTEISGKHESEMRVLNVSGIRELPMSNPNQSMTSLFSGFSSNDKGFGAVFIFKLNPPLMSSEIGKMSPRLNADGSNFASYYLYVLQQKQGAMFEVVANLRDVLSGFDSFAVDEDFEQGKRRLMVIFKNPDGLKNSGRAPLKLSFDDLSDGQRALIVLYTLLFCALDENATLVIDEPENYIALPRIATAYPADGRAHRRSRRADFVDFT